MSSEVLKVIKEKINPAREMFKWGPIDFKFFYGSVFLRKVGVDITDYYPWGWSPYLIIYRKGKMLWLQDYNALISSAVKYFNKYFLDEKHFNIIWDEWESWVEEYEKKSKEWDKIEWENISDEKLYKIMEDFFDFNISFWLIVHVPEISNWGGEYLLKNELVKINKDDADDYMEILSAPVKYSFFQEEELDLLELGLEKNKEKYKNNLNNHAKKFHWLLNSYGGNRILGPDYFDNKLREILKNKTAKEKMGDIVATLRKNKLRKKELIKKLGLSEKVQLTAYRLSESIWWQDLRKGYIWRMHFYLEIFLKEISKRKGYDLETLRWCDFEEFLKLSKNKNNAMLDEIAKRKDYFMIFSSDKKFSSFTDGIIIEEILDFYTEKAGENVRELKGMAVSKGKNSIVKGMVKIVYNPFDSLKNFKEGEILVTGMTSPEYIILMKKAKAIITDHGGFTSHAAIVSRELSVPCIVGTKIATQVLKDGDLVEVDADKGIVKILSCSK